MSTERKALTPATLKALFAKSGNKCAFPDCNAPLIDERDIFVGQVCHINAVGKQDARFDPDLTSEYLRSRENLILLCYPHHRRIDQLPEDFSVETLKDFRKKHEANQQPYDVPEHALGQALMNALRDEWIPDLSSVQEFLEQELKEIQHQSGMNALSGLISDILDVQVHYELMRLLKSASAEQVASIVQDQEGWRDYRYQAAAKAVESHGGSLAPLEYNWKFNELSLERVKELRKRRGSS